MTPDPDRAVRTPQQETLNVDERLRFAIKAGAPNSDLLRAALDELAWLRAGGCACWCGARFRGVSELVQHVGKAGHLRV